MCKLSYTCVVGYDITPNQSDLDTYLEKQFTIKAYKIHHTWRKWVRFTKQILKIMANNNIKYCEQNEEEEIYLLAFWASIGFIQQHLVTYIKELNIL